MKYAYMITERIYVHKGKSRKGHFLDSCGVPTQGKLKNSKHVLNLSVQNALDCLSKNFNLKNFTGGTCARDSLEKCVLRNPDVYYISRTPLSQNAPSAPGSTVLQ